MNLFSENDTLFLIEPRFHGIKYIKAALSGGLKVIAFFRENYPFEIPENIQIIYANVFNAEEIAQIIISSESYRDKNIAVLPGTEPFVSVAAEVNAILNKKSISPIVAQSAHNKSKMREALTHANVLCPKSKLYYNSDEIYHDKDAFIFPLVVKPLNLTGSVLVKLVNDFDDLINATSEILRNGKIQYDYPIIKGLLIEEYIIGREFSVEIVLDNGKIWFSSVTEKQKDNLPFFVEVGHVVPASNTSDEENQILINCAFKSLIGIGIDTGPAHVEIILSNGNPYVIELAARLGGDNIMDLIKLAYNVDIPLNVIKQSLGYSLKTCNQIALQGAVIRFLKAKSGYLTGIEGLDMVAKNSNIKEVHIQPRIGDYIPNLTNSDDRIGYIIATGSDNKHAKTNAKWATDTINLIIND